MTKVPRKILKNNYVKIVFFLFFIFSFYIIPRKIFTGWYTLLGVSFMITFSLLMTYFSFGLKERFKNARNAGKNIVGIVAGLFGLSALQVCSVGAAFCGVSFGSTIVAIIFPEVAFHFLSRYAVAIIIISILIQIYALYKIYCLEKNN